MSVSVQVDSEERSFKLGNGAMITYKYYWSNTQELPSGHFGQPGDIFVTWSGLDALKKVDKARLFGKISGSEWKVWSSAGKEEEKLVRHPTVTGYILWPHGQFRWVKGDSIYAFTASNPHVVKEIFKAERLHEKKRKLERSAWTSASPAKRRRLVMTREVPSPPNLPIGGGNEPMPMPSVMLSPAAPMPPAMPFTSESIRRVNLRTIMSTSSPSRAQSSKPTSTPEKPSSSSQAPAEEPGKQRSGSPVIQSTPTDVIAASSPIKLQSPHPTSSFAISISAAGTSTPTKRLSLPHGPPSVNETISTPAASMSQRLVTPTNLRLPPPPIPPITKTHVKNGKTMILSASSKPSVSIPTSSGCSSAQKGEERERPCTTSGASARMPSPAVPPPPRQHSVKASTKGKERVPSQPIPYSPPGSRPSVASVNPQTVVSSSWAPGPSGSGVKLDPVEKVIKKEPIPSTLLSDPISKKDRVVIDLTLDDEVEAAPPDFVVVMRPLQATWGPPPDALLNHDLANLGYPDSPMSIERQALSEAPTISPLVITSVSSPPGSPACDLAAPHNLTTEQQEFFDRLYDAIIQATYEVMFASADGFFMCNICSLDDYVAEKDLSETGLIFSDHKDGLLHVLFDHCSWNDRFARFTHEDLQAYVKAHLC